MERDAPLGRVPAFNIEDTGNGRCRRTLGVQRGDACHQLRVGAQLLQASYGPGDRGPGLVAANPMELNFDAFAFPLDRHHDPFHQGSSQKTDHKVR